MHSIVLKNRIKKKYKEIFLLFIYTLICFSFSIWRVYYTDSKTFIFLNWNLFLAFVPWTISSTFIVFPKLIKKKIILFLSMSLWLAFFPNTLYILTDLLHLKGRSWSTIWYDLILILSFAWTGILYGFLSLKDLEFILGQKIKTNFVKVVVFVFLFISSFGVYMGRYLRWNSWDLLHEPQKILHDILIRFTNPFEHPRTWGMTILLGLFLNMVYWSVTLIGKRNVEKLGS